MVSFTEWYNSSVPVPYSPYRRHSGRALADIISRFHTDHPWSHCQVRRRLHDITGWWTIVPFTLYIFWISLQDFSYRSRHIRYCCLPVQTIHLSLWQPCSHWRQPPFLRRCSEQRTRFIQQCTCLDDTLVALPKSSELEYCVGSMAAARSQWLIVGYDIRVGTLILKFIIQTEICKSMEHVHTGI